VSFFFPGSPQLLPFFVGVALLCLTFLRGYSCRDLFFFPVRLATPFLSRCPDFLRPLPCCELNGSPGFALFIHFASCVVFTPTVLAIIVTQIFNPYAFLLADPTSLCPAENDPEDPERKRPPPVLFQFGPSPVGFFPRAVFVVVVRDTLDLPTDLHKVSLFERNPAVVPL